MEPLVRRPLQARSRQTLAAIVSAAEELLAGQPFDAVSVADIVRRAGCTTGSFYARFASKEALLPYLYDKYDEALGRRLEALAADESLEHAPLEDTVRRLLGETVASFAGRVHLMREI